MYHKMCQIILYKGEHNIVDIDISGGYKHVNVNFIFINGKSMLLINSCGSLYKL